MMQRVLFLIIVTISLPAYASYNDGFFGFLAVIFAIPVLIIGLYLTKKYYSKSWFKDRNFTIFYIVLWLLFTIMSISYSSHICIVTKKHNCHVNSSMGKIIRRSKQIRNQSHHSDTN